MCWSTYILVTFSFKSHALAPSPASLRASVRSSSVAKLVLPRLSPGAHWSHSSSIATSQLRGALWDRFGLASILASSPVRKPRCMPISLHLAAWIFSWRNSNGRSLLVSCLVLFSSSARKDNQYTNTSGLVMHMQHTCTCLHTCCTWYQYQYTYLYARIATYTQTHTYMVHNNY